VPVEEMLAVDGLSFRFNSAEVLSGISFALGRGDYLGLVGPNGSGKTTLIRCILGFSKPNEGRVSIMGKDPALFAEWRKIGYLPQKIASFNPHFPATVKEIIALGLLGKKGFPRRLSREDEVAIERALKITGTGSIGNKLIGQLSGGQQQRVLIAKALVAEPELLILDEPTTALDPEARENFFSLMSRLNHELTTTIIIVTHDIGNIGKYASKLLYLDKRVVFFGSFDDFCVSDDMASYFGRFSQHLICHRHDEAIGPCGDS
jgi:zinc transport system ATP-binding protein